MKEKTLNRIEFLFDLIKKYEDNIKDSTVELYGVHSKVKKYDKELYEEILFNIKSFIQKLYGEDSLQYQNLISERIQFSDFGKLRGYLRAIKYEIDNDWLLSLKGIISSEVFTDFIEMAEHLLEENYKDASAVLIGSTLESHLKQLSLSNNNPIETDNGRPKKASTINDELYKQRVYNKLENKNITAWLDLRNSAAHGNYGEYTNEQVALLIENVKSFINRNPIK